MKRSCSVELKDWPAMQAVDTDRYHSTLYFTLPHRPWQGFHQPVITVFFLGKSIKSCYIYYLLFKMAGKNLQIYELSSSPTALHWLKCPCSASEAASRKGHVHRFTATVSTSEDQYEELIVLFLWLKLHKQQKQQLQNVHCVMVGVLCQLVGERVSN